MSTPRALLFKTVPERDYLQFWQNDTFEPQRVARFLDLTKADVAKVANVASASVRFDYRYCLAPLSVAGSLKGDGGLLSPTLALRSPASFTHVGLRGKIEIVIDISDPRHLHAVAGVLREFTLPDSVRRDRQAAQHASSADHGAFRRRPAATAFASRLAHLSSPV
jgi:hypothetical protein